MELLNEKELYVALSDLFVDNQADYNHIASVVKLYPISYVEHVLFYYVAPACHYNTIGPVPPVWCFFDEDDLMSAIDDIKKNKIAPFIKSKCVFLFSILSLDLNMNGKK